MITPRAGFGLVSLKTGEASDQINMLAIGGIRLSIESVNSSIVLTLTCSNEYLTDYDVSQLFYVL